MKIFPIACCAVCLSGCASIVNNSDYPVSFVRLPETQRAVLGNQPAIPQ